MERSHLSLFKDAHHDPHVTPSHFGRETHIERLTSCFLVIKHACVTKGNNGSEMLTDVLT